MESNEDTVEPNFFVSLEAEEYHALGRQRFVEGDIEDAAAYYQTSIDLFPTAEAHTDLGVVLASKGEWEGAISQCKVAIALSPDIGNPYNDIGVYLAELDRIEEALEWFNRAIEAPDYDCRHYPHFHRGRLLEQLGRFTEARDAFHHSLAIEPGWQPAQLALQHVLGWLN